MKILERYVLKSFVLAFFFCIVLLVVLGIIGDILGFLDDIFKHNIPFSSIFLFYFYLAPFAFVNMVPFASLLSAVYVFNTFSKTQEVTAVITTGTSLWRILKPVLVTTFMFCLVTFIVNDKLVPLTMEKANQIRQEKLEKRKLKNTLTIKDLITYGKNNQIIYAKSFNPITKTFYNVIIHIQDANQKVIKKLSARVVKWHKDEYWQGKDVIVFKVDPKGNFVGNPEVSKEKKISMEEEPKDFISHQWDSRFMSYKQLKEYLKVFNVSSQSTVQRLLVDLNYKLSFPFTSIVTVLVGIPFSIERGRSSALIGMARGIMVAMLYLPVMSVSLALGKGGVLPPVVSAWLTNAIFLVVGIYYVGQRS